MICETISRLHPFGKIAQYRYIGFGSIYFSDFQLLHKTFGIDDLLSIEKDEYAKECFEFNKPFKCVTIDYRSASDVLPGLDWGKKSIVWLDYDTKLDQSILNDISTVCTRACPGSLLIVTVNASVETHPDEQVQKDYKEETGLDFDINAYRLHELRKTLE